MSTLKLVEMGTTATQLRNLFERNNKKKFSWKERKTKIKGSNKNHPE